MTRLLLPLAEMPACITDSVRVCLAAHGLTLSEEVLVELGRNAAQALISIDETPIEDDVEYDAGCSCGWKGPADLAADHPCRFEHDDQVAEPDALDVFHRATFGGAIGTEKIR